MPNASQDKKQRIVQIANQPKALWEIRKYRKSAKPLIPFQSWKRVETFFFIWR